MVEDRKIAIVRNAATRNELKKLYKKKRLRDGAEVGRKINDLTQVLHLQARLPEDKRDKAVVENCIDTLNDIRKQNRFRDDFPSFSKFYRYVTDPKNGFVLEDVREI